MIIIITGKSGSGKSTLSHHLEEEHDYNIPFNITTRAPRSYDDSDYSEYRFVSKELFNYYKDNGSLLNHTEFNGNQYGTTGTYGDKTVFVVDQQGREDLLKVFPEATTVWVEVSELERRKRLYDRGLRGEELESRMDGPSEQMTPSQSCLIINGAVDTELEVKRLFSYLNQ